MTLNLEALKYYTLKKMIYVFYKKNILSDSPKLANLVLCVLVDIEVAVQDFSIQSKFQTQIRTSS